MIRKRFLLSNFYCFIKTSIKLRSSQILLITIKFRMRESEKREHFDSSLNVCYVTHNQMTDQIARKVIETPNYNGSFLYYRQTSKLFSHFISCRTYPTISSCSRNLRFEVCRPNSSLFADKYLYLSQAIRNQIGQPQR